GFREGGRTAWQSVLRAVFVDCPLGPSHQIECSDRETKRECKVYQRPQRPHCTPGATGHKVRRESHDDRIFRSFLLRTPSRPILTAHPQPFRSEVGRFTANNPLLESHTDGQIRKRIRTHLTVNTSNVTRSARATEANSVVASRVNRTGRSSTRASLGDTAKP